MLKDEGNEGIMLLAEARKKAEAERGRLFHMAVNAEQKAPTAVMKSQEKIQKLF